MSFFDRLKRLMGGQDPSQKPSRDNGGRAANADLGECRSITCMEALERVHEYLDGELSEVSHQEVAHHFAICKRCYPHLRLEERFKEALRRSQEEEACPDHVKAKVLELLASEAQG